MPVGATDTVGSSARNFLPNLGKTLLKDRKDLAVWRERDVFSPAQDRALG